MIGRVVTKSEQTLLLIQEFLTMMEQSAIILTHPRHRQLEGDSMPAFPPNTASNSESSRFSSPIVHSIRRSERQSRYCYIFAFLLLSIFGFCTKDTLGQTVILPAAWQHKSFPNAFVPHQRTFPRISNGFLWSRLNELTKAEPDSIVLEPIDGGPGHSISFWIPGASKIWLEDAAITQDRKIIVVGSFERLGDSTQNNFVSQLDFQGRVLSMSSLGEYEPERVCSTSDGTVWMIGQVWMAEMQRTSYAILRNYSTKGELLGSYLQRNVLPATDLNLSARLDGEGSAHGRVFLACGAKFVAAYIGTARTWTEVSIPDHAAHAWQVRSPSAKSAMKITGLAVVGEHGVYASFEPSSSGSNLPKWSLYKLDTNRPDNAVWTRVVPDRTGDEEPPVFEIIVGADASSVVFWSKQDLAPGIATVLSWSKP
jgi:hypothetical protein